MLAAIGSLGAAPTGGDQLINLPVEAEGRLRSRQELENLVLRRLDNGGLLRLKDVGRVDLGQRNYGSQAKNLRASAPSLSGFINATIPMHCRSAVPFGSSCSTWKAASPQASTCP